MIIINIDKKIKSINQDLYNKFVKRSVLKKILVNSQLKSFVIHGSYSRKLINEDGDFFDISIMRIRVGHVTHAVFLSPMIPFLHCYFDDIFTFDFTTPVSESSRYYMMKVLCHCHHSYPLVCQRFINCIFVSKTT